MSLILRAPLAMRIQARAVDWRSRRESLPVRRGWGERRGSMRAWIVTPPHLVDGNPLRRFETLTPPAPLSQPPPGLTGERGAGHPNKGGIALGCSPSSPGGRGGGWEKRAGVMRATAGRPSVRLPSPSRTVYTGCRLSPAGGEVRFELSLQGLGALDGEVVRQDAALAFPLFQPVALDLLRLVVQGVIAVGQEGPQLARSFGGDARRRQVGDAAGGELHEIGRAH